MLFLFVKCEGNEAPSWAGQAREEQVAVRNRHSLDVKGGRVTKIG